MNQCHRKNTSNQVQEWGERFDFTRSILAVWGRSQRRHMVLENNNKCHPYGICIAKSSRKCHRLNNTHRIYQYGFPNGSAIDGARWPGPGESFPPPFAWPSPPGTARTRVDYRWQWESHWLSTCKNADRKMFFSGCNLRENIVKKWHRLESITNRSSRKLSIRRTSEFSMSPSITVCMRLSTFTISSAERSLVRSTKFTTSLLWIEAFWKNSGWTIMPFDKAVPMFLKLFKNVCKFS